MNVDFDQQDIIIELPPEGKDGRSIHPAGEWSADAEYHSLDIVSYNGSSYMATRSVPAGTLPTDAEYWQVVAEKGEPGASEWGEIAGNIADQTDLQDALDSKADASDVEEGFADVAEALAGKANVGDSYTKAEDDALLAQKADADSVYTKTETDALLSDKADTDDVYSKTEVNTLLSGKADADTVYTKTETDTLLDAKADVGDSYTKAEEDALLAVKANSADVYTKTETDTLLADKADADDVYTKTDVDDALADKADSADVYTKDETNALLADKAPVILNSASGSIASFSDGSPAPVTALSVAIDPVQDLHGYDNPWPAGGGANLISDGTDTNNGYSPNMYLVDNGNEIASPANYNISEFIPVIPSETYGWKRWGSLTPATPALCFYDSNKEYISGEAYNSRESFTITTPSTAAYVRLTIPNVSTAWFIFVKGSSLPNAWTPYSNICPISGHSTATVTRTGKNLLSLENIKASDHGLNAVANSDGSINISGTTTGTWSVVCSYTNIPFKIGTYTFSIKSALEHRIYVRFHHSFENTSDYTDALILPGQTSKTITLSRYAVNYELLFSYLVSGTAYNETIYPQLELGSSASAFEPYQGTSITIDLNGTRYGGTLNVLTGEMVVDRAIVDLGTLTWRRANTNTTDYYRFVTNDLKNIIKKAATVNEVGNLLCSQYVKVSATATYRRQQGISVDNVGAVIVYDVPLSQGITSTNFKTAVSGVQLVYELATPLTVTLSPSQLSTLLGTNHIWADTGDVAVEYRADTKRYIDGVASATAKVTRQMIADSATADGKAPKSLATGDLIIVGDELRKATANIGNGSAITASNSTIATLADVIKALQ